MDTPNAIAFTTLRPQMALSLVDRLAQALRVAGAFPPVLGELRCEVLASTAPQARTFDPPRLLSSFINRSGYLILDGSYHDANEPSRMWPLGPGSYRLRLRSVFYQDAAFDLDWPPAPGLRRLPVAQPSNRDSIELFPSAAYPLPDFTLGRMQLGPTLIRGSAFAANGTPLPGLLAEVINLPLLQPPELPALGAWPFLSARSGPNGDWALVLPGRRYLDHTAEIPAPATLPLHKQINLRIGYPDGAMSTVQNVLLGSEHAVRNTGLRGQVLGPGGRPLGGVAISTSAGPRTCLSRPDGGWTLYFDLNQAGLAQLSVTATLPGRPPRTETSALLRPGSTVIVPTFHFS
jgi:hypothetical protein